MVHGKLFNLSVHTVHGRGLLKMLKMMSIKYSLRKVYRSYILNDKKETTI